eukprot:Trichotokara_eunicae@DN2737_c0_g1_i2.p1
MLTSPLFASIGCLLVLPVSIVWDLFVHGTAMGFGGFIGSSFIIFGFVGFLYAEFGTKDKEVYDYEILDKDAQFDNSAPTPGEFVAAGVEDSPPGRMTVSPSFSTPSPRRSRFSSTTSSRQGTRTHHLLDEEEKDEALFIPSADGSIIIDTTKNSNLEDEEVTGKFVELVPTRSDFV